jgi:hypothetical protein
MKMICRQLRQLANEMPPGPLRDQLEVDLTCLRVRLMALPARVAAHAPFETDAEVTAVLDREIRAAFADVAKWMMK